MKEPINAERKLVMSMTLGSKDAFRALYEKYKDKLERYCYSLLRSPEAEDIVQETFVKLWENRNRIDPDLFSPSYIRTIAYNKTISHLRSLQTEMKIKEYLAEETLVSEENSSFFIEMSEYENYLKAVVEKLPPQRKIIFRLSRENGLTHKEIAQQMGISICTVQEHVSESLRFIRIHFSRHPDISLPIHPKQKVS